MITTCNRFRDNGKNYACTYKNQLFKKESSFQKKILHPLSDQMRFEQYNQFCLNPSSLLNKEDPTIQIEYYD